MEHENFSKEVWEYVARTETTKVIKQAIYSKRVMYNYEDILQDVRCSLYIKFTKNPEKFNKVKVATTNGLLRSIATGLVLDRIRSYDRFSSEVLTSFEVEGEVMA